MDHDLGLLQRREHRTAPLPKDCQDAPDGGAPICEGRGDGRIADRNHGRDVDVVVVGHRIREERGVARDSVVKALRLLHVPAPGPTPANRGGTATGPTLASAPFLTKKTPETAPPLLKRISIYLYMLFMFI